MYHVQPPKVQMISAFNNFFGSVVGVQNSLLAPLAPFGRKLQSYDGGIVESVGNTNTNPVSPAVHLQTAALL